MTKKEDKKEKSITESFLGKIPFLGSFFKELGKTEVFKKRFEEVDAKIIENLKNGKKKTWGFEANVSFRPIISKMKKENSELSIHKDYFYKKENNKLTLAMRVPPGKARWKIEGKNLFIKADNFEKKIEVPDYYQEIKKTQYKEGILVLELTK